MANQPNIERTFSALKDGNVAVKNAAEEKKQENNPKPQNQNMIVTILSHIQGQSHIVRPLKESGYKVQIFEGPSSLENLKFAINQESKILCLFCLGIYHASYETFQGQVDYHFQFKADQNAERGLQSHFKNKNNGLLILMSSYSEVLGKALFQQQKDRHVICIEKSNKINEQLSQNFCQQFFRNLFNQKLTICQSYYRTQQELLGSNKYSEIEIRRIVLLRNHSMFKCNNLQLIRGLISESELVNGVIQNASSKPALSTSFFQRQAGSVQDQNNLVTQMFLDSKKRKAEREMEQLEHSLQLDENQQYAPDEFRDYRQEEQSQAQDLGNRPGQPPRPQRQNAVYIKSFPLAPHLG